MCEACEHSFTTIERPSLADMSVIDHQQHVEPFNSGQLICSIADAFGHDRTKGKKAALWLAQTVETTLASQKRQISVDDIEATTHHVLRQFDEVAAVQYGTKQRLIVSAKRAGRPSLVSSAPPNQPSPSR